MEQFRVFSALFYANRSACYLQAGNFKGVLEDTSTVLEILNLDQVVVDMCISKEPYNCDGQGDTKTSNLESNGANSCDTKTSNLESNKTPHPLTSGTQALVGGNSAHTHPNSKVILGCVKALTRRGTALLELEMAEEALTEFETALKLAPWHSGLKNDVEKIRNSLKI